MLKYRLFFILMLLLGIVTSSFAQEEIQIGDTVEGEDDDDPVEYELFLEEGQAVEITLTSEDFDTYLYLLDEDGDEIAYNDDHNGDTRVSYIAYTAEDSETYIIQVASCCSGSGPTDDYELSVEEVVVQEEIDGGSMAYGDSLVLEASGTEQITVTFEGTEGDVITITAVSEDGEDTNLTLSDPDNDEVAFNEDDGGINRNPAIRRFELSSTGQYTIEIEGFADALLFSDIEVTLELSDLLLVTEGPQTIEFTPDFIADIMTFDVEEDVSYLVSVTLSEASESSLLISILEEDQSYALTRLSVSNTSAFTFVFTPEDTGRAQIKLEFYTYDDDVEVTIEAEAIAGE